MKGTILLVLAVVAGLGAAFLTRKHIQDQTGETKAVFRALEDIPVGEIVGDRAQRYALPTKLFPALFDDAPTTSSEGFVRNTPVKQAIRAGDVILYRHLDTSVDPEIRAGIPVGMRALTLPVSERAAVAFFIEPGDLVDVFATAADPATGELVNKPLLKAVEVLAVGSRYWRGDFDRASRQAYGTLTLLVTIEEAQKLSLAGAVLQGDMTFLLRNPEDRERSQQVTPLSVNSGEFDRIGNR